VTVSFEFVPEKAESIHTVSPDAATPVAFDAVVAAFAHVS
jgi:hypothetical protein